MIHSTKNKSQYAQKAQKTDHKNLGAPSTCAGDSDQINITSQSSLPKELCSEVISEIDKQATTVFRKVYFSCPCCAPIHVMNTKADGSSFSISDDYMPSYAEECANIVTHLIPALIAVYTLYNMLNTVVNTKREKISAIVFGGSCIMLFSVSAIYHSTGLLFGYRGRLNRVFQKADHTMIYTFIASSYTPWLALVDFTVYHLSLSQIFLGLVWGIAIFGLVKSVANVFPSIQGLVVYLFMGWISVLYMILFFSFMAVGAFETRLPLWSLVEIMFGGLFYTIGACVFFRLDGSIPFSHAIWHLFTVVAAFVHYHAIHVYVMALE